jgi:hypothetical protein
MSKSVLSSVSQFITYLDDGEIDWDTTFFNFQSYVLFEMELLRDNDQKIETALDQLFDQVTPGNAIPVPIVVSTIANKVADGDVSKATELTHVVHDFLERSKRFSSRRGRNGGLVRLAVL